MKFVCVKRLQTADCIQDLNKPAFFEYYIFFYFKLQFMMDGIIIMQSSATNIPFFSTFFTELTCPGMLFFISQSRKKFFLVAALLLLI